MHDASIEEQKGHFCSQHSRKMGPALPMHGFSSSKGRIDFAAASKCRYVDLFRYPDTLAPHKEEGELDDKSLPKWFDKVLRAVEQKLIVWFINFS